MHDETLTYPTALAARLTAFLSACILPTVSAYLACVSRYSFEELAAERPAGLQYKVMASPPAFALGFAVINIFPRVSASLPERLAMRHHQIIQIAGTVLAELAFAADWRPLSWANAGRRPDPWRPAMGPFKTTSK